MLLAQTQIDTAVDTAPRLKEDVKTMSTLVIPVEVSYECEYEYNQVCSRDEWL